jgi:hypothetical protein
MRRKKPICRDECVGRIRIRETHDTFAVPQQLADAPRVQPGIVHGCGVDREQVVAQGISTGQIEICPGSSIPDSFKIQRVVLAFHIVR